MKLHLSLALTLAFVFLGAGCSIVEVEEFHHAETDGLGKERRPGDLTTYAAFVDQGMLITPEVDQLAIAPVFRSFFVFYSEEPKDVFVHKVIARDPSSGITTERVVDKAFAPQAEAAGGHSAAAPVFFRDSPHSAEVFQAQEVELELIYEVGVTASTGQPRSATFLIKRRKVKKTVWAS